MRVTILNTCSTLNRGDAAIVLGQIYLVRKSCPDARIALTSKTPALDAAFFAPFGVEVLPPLTPALSSGYGARGKLMVATRALSDVRGKRRLIAVVRDSDLILSCGGGYFYSYRHVVPGTTFWQNVIHARVAIAAHKPLIFMPQSFGPFSGSLARIGVKWVLEAASVSKVFAREAISYQQLHEMIGPRLHARIALCPDMALYLHGQLPHDTPVDPVNSEATPTLVMNLREWSFPSAVDPVARGVKREAYLSALEAAARFFIERYRGSVVVVPQSWGPDPSEDDRAICVEFCRRFEEHSVDGGAIDFLNPDTTALDEYLHLLSQATMLIGARLHACLLAMLSGTPAISIGYQHKSRGTLDLLGLARFNLSIDDLSAEQLLLLVQRVMDHREDIREEIGLALEDARTRIDGQVGSLIASGAGR